MLTQASETHNEKYDTIMNKNIVITLIITILREQTGETSLYKKISYKITAAQKNVKTNFASLRQSVIENICYRVEFCHSYYLHINGSKPTQRIASTYTSLEQHQSIAHS